jgi:hypothetical protein
MALPKKVSLGASNIPAEDHDVDEVIASNQLLAEQNAELMARIEALTREANTPLTNIPKAGARPMFARVRIILEESDHIAPSGQYFGIHGNWVNPETLLALEEQVQAKEMTRKEAQVQATETITFEAILRPGEEADVPVELLATLNDAITSVPSIDPGTFQVLGYKDRLRFPYRIVQGR